MTLNFEHYAQKGNEFVNKVSYGAQTDRKHAAQRRLHLRSFGKGDQNNPARSESSEHCYVSYNAYLVATLLL